MSIIADLHLHSKYSRAVSQKMDLVEMARWAKKKGIDLLGTADWTHPLWFREIESKLEETSSGIFSLKKEETHNYSSLHKIKFILSTEISSIYVQNGKQRRIHNLVLSPSLETAKKVIAELQKRGANLLSDGRPIIGLSAKEFLEMLLSIDKNILLIPCHVWTPWFSLYGSKSGFDSIEECFGEYSKDIYAIETGLSSDPIMNWQIKELETRSIVSFSDAHSGPKLGREATVFIENQNSRLADGQAKRKTQNLNYNFFDIINALKQASNSKLKIAYTIEFFPEEGKYHWSGHRLCGVRYSPKEVKEKGVICPVCQKPLTIGVENRVFDLSSKMIEEKELIKLQNSAGLTFVYDPQKKRRPFVSLVPLLEILLEIFNQSPTKAEKEYERLVNEFAPEFEILLKKSYEEIALVGGERLAEAIKIVRERKVFVDPGYDGVFGKVKVFGDKNESANSVLKKTEKQETLF